MKKNHIFSALRVLAFSVLALSSCTEAIMDDINYDKNHPVDAKAKYIITDLITSTAFSGVGGDLNTYAGVYMEHDCGIDNQLYRAEIRSGEPILSMTYNNSWGSLYINLKNALTAIAKCSENGSEPKNKVTLGVAEVLAAYNLALLTDLYGDIPWKEACNITLTLQPKIDKQEEIYTSILGYIDSAITHLAGTDTDGLGGQDLMYGGNKALWTKAAYGLKARYTMRLLAKSKNKSADLANIVDYCNKSFASAGEEMKFAKYDAASAYNPYHAACWSRDYVGASKSILDLLVALNDPRADQLFLTQGWEQLPAGDIVAAPNGKPKEEKYFYDTSIFYASETAPTQLLSYHEVQFLKAEALVRLDRKAEALEALEKAVTAAFANANNSIQASIDSPALNKYGGITAEAGLTPDVAADYCSEQLADQFSTNALRTVMVQKYLAFWGASGESIEAYNDYRRLKAMNETHVVLANEKNSTMFPQRFAYGADDVTANTHVGAAYGNGQYVYTEKVWWAGGTR